MIARRRRSLDSRRSRRRAPRPLRRPSALRAESAGALAKEIERLANQFFLGLPGPALNVASPVAALPAQVPAPVALPRAGPARSRRARAERLRRCRCRPLPGWAQAPPLASAPPPKESDFRAVPTLLADQLGLASPLVLVSVPMRVVDAVLPGSRRPAGPVRGLRPRCPRPTPGPRAAPRRASPATGLPSRRALDELPACLHRALTGVPPSLPPTACPRRRPATSLHVGPAPTSPRPAVAHAACPRRPSPGWPASDVPLGGAHAGLALDDGRAGAGMGPTDFQPELVPESRLADPPVRAEHHQAGLPDPARARARAAARLARQRGDDAEAAGRHRSDLVLLRARELERPPRRAHARGARDRRLRGRARQGAALPQRAVRRRRSSSCAARPRRSTSSPRAGGAATSAPATRSSSPGSSTTRTSFRGSSSAPRRARACASRPVDDRGEVHARRVREAARPADAHRLDHPGLQRARDHPPGARDGRRWPTATARGCWSTARRPSRTCRSTCRRSTATSTSSRATRSSRRRASACSSARQTCSRRCRPGRAAGT